MSYRQLYDKIKSIKFDEGILKEEQLNTSLLDKQTHCINTLMNTELNYLTKIKDLLIVMHNSFDKFSFRAIINKSQLLTFYQHMPIIFDFHLALRVKLNKELNSSQLIGKCLIEFLINPDLLDIYLAYVNSISVYLNLCQQIRSNENSSKYPNLCSLESIIMMPIQRFPQLQLVIGDIYKNTIDTHEDKVNLYKAICLLKSMSLCLDKHQKHLESIEISEISQFMKRLKISLKSQKVISKNSVFYLKPDFTIPRKLIKLSYYLVLCDKEIIMYPRDSHMIEIPQDMVFYYSFSEIKFQIKNTFNFSHQNKSKEFQMAKELFPLIKDSFMNDKIIVEVGEIINDYDIIVKIYDEVKRLNFSYHSLEQLKIARSLLKLEKKLSKKERELNNYFDSILNLKIMKTGSYEDIKLFQFDSSRLTGEWKTNFYRTNLLFGLNVLSDWIPIIVGNQSISNNISPEFPLSGDPYLLSNNGILYSKCNVVRSQTVIIVIETKISRCLWVSMSNGSVIILHFNYKAWTVLKSFQTEFKEPVNQICKVSFFDPNIADIRLDSEMWISYKNQIISYSLEHNHRSLRKFSLKFPSDVNAMCQFDEKMFIGLQSLNVYIYSNKVLSRWALDSTICLQECASSRGEELQKIVGGNKNLMYFVFRRIIAVYEVSERKNEPIKVFSTIGDISCFHIHPEGIWISIVDDLNLKMYDNVFKLILQNISLPISFFGKHSIDSVTSILLTEKYLWIGTKTGFIIIVSTIDRLSCIDSKVTMYLNSKCSNSPIDILLPFQSIHGLNLKSKYETEIKNRNVSETKVCRPKRCHSTPPKIEGNSNYLNFSSDDNSNSLETEDKVDGFPRSASNIYGDFKNSAPMIILAIGNGFLQFTDYKSNGDIYPNINRVGFNEQSLFTFLE